MQHVVRITNKNIYAALFESSVGGYFDFMWRSICRYASGKLKYTRSFRMLIACRFPKRYGKSVLANFSSPMSIINGCINAKSKKFFGLLHSKCEELRVISVCVREVINTHSQTVILSSKNRRRTQDKQQKRPPHTQSHLLKRVKECSCVGQ